MSLSPGQLKRYSRHVLLPEVGVEGQERLLQASVLVVGLGGLGSPITLYLAAAGVGRIGLLDFDVVDESNLQRQVLYSTDAVGSKKAEVAHDRLSALNPDIRLDVLDRRLSADNAEELFTPYDIVVDGTDNFGTRYLVNDACVFFGKTNVYGSIYRFEGQISVFATPGGPCYRCLFPEPPPPGAVPNCAEAGVLGILPGQVGVVQATEVIKLILGTGSSLVGRLLLFDALAMKWKEMRISRNPSCPLCGDSPSITELTEYGQFCTGVGQAETAPGIESMTPLEAKALLDAGEDLLLLDVREPFECEIARIEGATFIPLGELEARLTELDAWRDRTVIAYCKAGIRSAKALATLQQHDFNRLINLDGGIDRWARDLDPEMTRY
jgi:sulfur-carrier protein adenylyltransferase/sulfurtransferase